MVKYDVILVDFPHRQHDGSSSIHPAIILDDNTLLSCAQVTSKLKTLKYKNTYLLKDWREAKLDYESVVRLDQVENFSASDVIAKFGHLSDRDIEGIENILKNKEVTNGYK